MVSNSCRMLDALVPKEHLNLSNLPCIILSAMSCGSAVSRCAMCLKRSSNNCCTLISIKADPIAWPGEKFFRCDLRFKSTRSPSTWSSGTSLVGSPLEDLSFNTLTSCSASVQPCRSLKPCLAHCCASTGITHHYNIITLSEWCQCFTKSRVGVRSNLQVLLRNADRRGFCFCQSDFTTMFQPVLAESCRTYETFEGMYVSGISPCSGHTEHPFDTLSGPLREAIDKPLHNVVVYTGEIITIIAFRIGVREVLVLVVVFWIEI
jgi:hypothetical protein